MDLPEFNGYNLADFFDRPDIIQNAKMTNFFLKGFFKGFKIFGRNIALIVNTILLTFVYLLGVGPTSIIARLFKKDFLDLKSSGKSYWKPIDNEKRDIDYYYRQF